MIKIFIVWAKDPVSKIETIVAWDRNRKQAELKMQSAVGIANQFRLSEYTIEQSALSDLRQVLVNVSAQLLTDVMAVSKEIGANPTEILLLRHEIVLKNKLAQSRIGTPDGLIYDSEVDAYLLAVEAGII